MSYPLFLTLHLFAALVFIGAVFFEVLFLESIRKQLPAKVKVLLEQGISRRAQGAAAAVRRGRSHGLAAVEAGLSLSELKMPMNIYDIASDLT